MSGVATALGAAAYAASFAALALAAFVPAQSWLPSRSRLGLRLLATLTGQLVLTAILVQGLGLAGLLRPGLYLAASLLAGAAALVVGRPLRPLKGFAALLGRSFRLLATAPGPLLGPATLLGLFYLGCRFFALPTDVDALANHASLVAAWVQSGRVGLGDSRWNYPLVWEYQFAPGCLLLRSDLLTIVPALLAALALFLVLRELARELGLAGLPARLAALLLLTSPVVWREALKADPAFALAQLLGLLAVLRARRGARGAFWLLQLALFLIFGAKASGFFYGALLLGAYLWARRGQPRPEGHAGRLVLALLMQAAAAAVQLRNLATFGNPMYPLQWRLGPFLIFDGPSDPSGTAILDRAGQAETWQAFAGGAGVAAGLEWPLLLLLLVVAGVKAAATVGRRLAGGRPARRGTAFAVVAAAAWLLWLIFAATPWVLGLAPGVSTYLANGQSLRFAIAPLGLTYLLAAAGLDAARRRFARTWSPPAAHALTLGCLVLAVFKWRGVGLGEGGAAWLWPLGAVWLLLAAAPPLRRAWRRLAATSRRKARVGLVASGALVASAAAGIYLRRVETYRDTSWTPAYREVIQAVAELPEDAAIAVNDERALFRYLLYGKNFTHQLVPVELGRQGDRGEVPAEIPGLYFFTGPRREDLEPAITKLEARGWRVVARPADRRGAFFVRR